MKGSFAQYAQESSTEIILYYINGNSETFSLPINSQQFQTILPQLLQQPWITFHLIDQTVCISTEKVMKIEIKPPINQMQGEGIFANSQRITPLQRNATR
ncbi:MULTISPECIES: hypothetical protein [Okeania]|uniref:Uncharacterized protein n=1 Tax=Okeania hirsuta TaxID=1458930 RepID=A0A3N6PCH4_9CYAN|nr:MULTISPECIES: hypothetical protein [Okeania]NEP40733.1 hypothetical protein [Okeania sp. SIO2H7]NET13716.1 hypothetical protein [Okeania sp. SIO1H6]NEP74290.1 hypothetical protein [Okeania sp. SIO2G5]NEP95289.1 hypothetical protein [Okeania sp. SIO2F5]NEQ74173.1 hypothetical protein [Okeania sp. SIO2C9]